MSLYIHIEVHKRAPSRDGVAVQFTVTYGPTHATVFFVPADAFDEKLHSY
jgi:hypothetical protein